MLVGRRILATSMGAGLTVLLAVGATSAPADSTTAADSSPASPAYKRVVLIVLDGLRPEFIDRFAMTNVQRLMQQGTSFKNAYLGHMGAETVVSHNVMTSGQLPKHMGWSDEWFRDADGVLGPVNDRYVTGSMSQPQFDALIQDKGYPKLADYLKTVYPDKTVAAIGEKTYATYTMGGPGADMRITFSGRNYDCDGDGVNNWRGPTGVNVPSYISGPTCNRYYVNADKALDYGTSTTSPAWMYPVEGNRDVPGTDPAHKGGDPWVTNAAFDVMDNEDWSGMLLTYGGIDKSGHLWGGLNDVPPYAGGDPAVHMANIAKVADRQVGRVMDKLKADGVLDETLVVVTTDHAQQTGTNFYGTDAAGQGNYNWYYGRDADETYEDPQPEIAKLIAGTDQNVEMSMQDSAIRTWLVDNTSARRKEAADVMATLAGVRASYYRDGDRYRLRWQADRSKFSDSSWAWYRKRGQELVDTMAAAYGPDVIGLLANNTTYGVKGDHGGAQKNVQRIPIMFSGAGVQAGSRRPGAMRSVDILPTILREMGIEPTYQMDGRSYRLP